MKAVIENVKIDGIHIAELERTIEEIIFTEMQKDEWKLAFMNIPDKNTAENLIVLKCGCISLTRDTNITDYVINRYRVFIPCQKHIQNFKGHIKELRKEHLSIFSEKTRNKLSKFITPE